MASSKPPVDQLAASTSAASYEIDATTRNNPNTPHPQPAAPSSQENKNWYDLFKHNSRPCKAFKLKEWPPEERDFGTSALRDCGFCLVGFILGRFPGMKNINDIRNGWKINHSFSIHESGWMIFRFDSEKDRARVLDGGPYESFGSPWLIKEMPDFFSFEDSCLTTVPTWIRLPELPIRCWSEEILSKIASHLGRPIMVDECTANISRTSFARILVEIDATKELKRNININLPNGNQRLQTVLYEKEPRFCTSCRAMGHDADHCKGKGLLRNTKFIERGRSKSRHQNNNRMRWRPKTVDEGKRRDISVENVMKQQKVQGCDKPPEKKRERDWWVAR